MDRAVGKLDVAGHGVFPLGDGAWPKGLIAGGSPAAKCRQSNRQRDNGRDDDASRSLGDIFHAPFKRAMQCDSPCHGGHADSVATLPCRDSRPMCRWHIAHCILPQPPVDGKAVGPVCRDGLMPREWIEGVA